MNDELLDKPQFPVKQVRPGLRRMMEQAMAFRNKNQETLASLTHVDVLLIGSDLHFLIRYVALLEQAMENLGVKRQFPEFENFDTKTFGETNVQ